MFLNSRCLVHRKSLELLLHGQVVFLDLDLGFPKTPSNCFGTDRDTHSVELKARGPIAARCWFPKGFLFVREQVTSPGASALGASKCFCMERRLRLSSASMHRASVRLAELKSKRSRRSNTRSGVHNLNKCRVNKSTQGFLHRKVLVSKWFLFRSRTRLPHQEPRLLVRVAEALGAVRPSIREFRNLRGCLASSCFYCSVRLGVI